MAMPSCSAVGGGWGGYAVSEDQAAADDISSPEEHKYTQDCILRWTKAVDLIPDISTLFSKEYFNFILKISTSFSK